MCFPTLFSIAQDKGITNVEYLSWRESSVVWDVTFMRFLYDLGIGRDAHFYGTSLLNKNEEECGR